MKNRRKSENGALGEHRLTSNFECVQKPRGACIERAFARTTYLGIKGAYKTGGDVRTDAKRRAPACRRKSSKVRAEERGLTSIGEASILLSSKAQGPSVPGTQSKIFQVL